MYGAAAAPILAPLLCSVARLLVRVSALTPSHFYCHPAARHSSFYALHLLAPAASNFVVSTWLSRARWLPLLVAHARTCPRRRVTLSVPLMTFEWSFKGLV
ncbi:hypothetical protein FB451DRAFT_1331220 [Mycena latifolia]|nr:hypothetical protein FB451DRAFT_1331220 [Mycena latifolia]